MFLWRILALNRIVYNEQISSAAAAAVFFPAQLIINSLYLPYKHFKREIFVIPFFGTNNILCHQ